MELQHSKWFWERRKKTGSCRNADNLFVRNGGGSAFSCRRIIIEDNYKIQCFFN